MPVSPHKRKTRRRTGAVAVAHKPGSVSRRSRLRRLGGHSSGTRVSARLVQPTQGLGRAALERPSTWPCSGRGLPCRNRHRLRGGLLPHRFTLTRGSPRGENSGGLFSVALSSRFPSPGVTRHPALWSPDFPLDPRGAERSPEPQRPSDYNADGAATLGAQAASSEPVLEVTKWARSLRLARASSCRARSRDTPRRRPISASESSSSTSAISRCSTM